MSCFLQRIIALVHSPSLRCTRLLSTTPRTLEHKTRGRPTPRGNAALRSARVELRKRFGQHLLKNADVVRNIVEKAHLQPHETVFEIGPGTGNLTVHLLEKALVVYAVELDPRLYTVLKARASSMIGLGSKLQVVLGDFLKVPLPHFDVLVANIPYQISSPVIKRLFEHRPLPSRAIIMFQREFADRLVAQPGTSAYCRLSVNTQLLSLSVRIVLKIGREQFRPPPKVDSAVVEIVPNPKGAPPWLHDFDDWDGFLRVCFSGGKNKTLRSIFSNKNVVATMMMSLHGPTRSPAAVASATGAPITSIVSGTTHQSVLSSFDRGLDRHNPSHGLTFSVSPFDERDDERGDSTGTMSSTCATEERSDDDAETSVGGSSSEDDDGGGDFDPAADIEVTDQADSTAAASGQGRPAATGTKTVSTMRGAVDSAQLAAARGRVLTTLSGVHVADIHPGPATARATAATPSTAAAVASASSSPLAAQPTTPLPVLQLRPNATPILTFIAMYRTLSAAGYRFIDPRRRRGAGVAVEERVAAISAASVAVQ